jgi:hypothetical protein
MVTITDGLGNVKRTVGLMTSMWGKVQSCREYARGLKFVSTPSHGGFIVSRKLAEKSLSQAALSRGVDYGNYKCYEEDCLAAIVDFELFDLVKPQVTKEQLLATIKQWNPAYLTERNITA